MLPTTKSRRSAPSANGLLPDVKLPPGSPRALGNLASGIAIALLLVSGVPSDSCAQAAAVLPPTGSRVPTKALPASYRITTGDVLNISIFQKPELTRSVTVPPDGRISFPFAGEVVVSGRTISEVTQRLKARLSLELSDPQVTVNLTRRQLQEVSILGPVRSPGKRILGDNWRVLQLIADSGGLSVKPEWATAKLVRGHGAEVVVVDLTQLMAGDASQNLLLMPDDTLLVDEVDSSRVALQVLGEVGKPGSILVPKDGSLLSVITTVGGFTSRASLSRVTLMRGGRTYTLDMRELMSTGKTTPALESGPASATTTATGGVAGITSLTSFTPAPASSTKVPETGLDSASIRAEPGDTLLVPQNRLLFSVMGAVNKPGVAEFPENQPVTVLSAITLAGGVNAAADLKNASVVRPDSKTGQPEIQPVNLEDLLGKKGKENKSKTRDVALQPGDVLYIPEKTPRGGQNGLQSVLSVLPILGWFVR
ncbi:MAG: polysaccharide biosynthesis/export family protein [Cytophagales bacterium]|nr:polysaccharide biosynthesis/export family protein [Armatimonadota bacterium]